MPKPVLYHENRFPPETINWEQLIPLLGPANAAVARYDGALAAVVNPAVLMSPLTTQEANRDEYYEKLLAISCDGDWTGWCDFFLKALIAQAEDNLDKTTKILDLYGRMKLQIGKITRSPYGMIALDWIFTSPIFKAPDFASHSGIPGATSRRILSAFRKASILNQLSKPSGQKASIFVFSDLLNIAEGRNTF